MTLQIARVHPHPTYLSTDTSESFIDKAQDSTPTAFDDTAQFMNLLSADPDVGDCVPRKALTYVVGPFDQLAAHQLARDLSKLNAAFDDQGRDLAQLLVAVTQTRALWQ